LSTNFNFNFVVTILIFIAIIPDIFTIQSLYGKKKKIFEKKNIRSKKNFEKNIRKKHSNVDIRNDSTKIQINKMFRIFFSETNVFSKVTIEKLQFRTYLFSIVKKTFDTKIVKNFRKKPSNVNNPNKLYIFGISSSNSIKQDQIR
jgi:hypothetical protein